MIEVVPNWHFFIKQTVTYMRVKVEKSNLKNLGENRGNGHLQKLA